MKNWTTTKKKEKETSQHPKKTDSKDWIFSETLWIMLTFFFVFVFPVVFVIIIWNEKNEHFGIIMSVVWITENIKRE